MNNYLFAIPVAFALAGGATAQSIHPPTREGFGAKPDSPETRRPDQPGTHRPEAQGGANSKQNLEYGKETSPEGKQLTDGQPATPKP